MACIGGLLFFSFYPMILIDAAVCRWRSRHERGLPPVVMRDNRIRLHDAGGNLTSAGDGEPFKPW